MILNYDVTCKNKRLHLILNMRPNEILINTNKNQNEYMFYIGYVLLALIVFS